MHIEVVKETEYEATFASPVDFKNIRLKNILVPTDFSQASAKALAYGIALSRQFDGMLSLLHVAEPMPSFTGVEGVPIILDADEELAKAERQMAEFAAVHVPSDVAVTSLVRNGSAVREISEFAKSHDIDLVIASTHDHTRLNRALFGGVTEKIVHNAPCPMLIVREQEHDFLDSSVADGAKAIHINRILAPIDFSDCSKKALRYAIAFASQFNAVIFCLHVLEPEKPMIIVETEGIRKTREIHARNNMLALIKEIDGAVVFNSLLASGAPHKEIIETADHHEVDLIVVGEHSRGGLGRFVLGSTTDEVVKRAHCPILVVRQVEHEFVDVGPV